jgi:hypothetical protein
MYKFIFGSTTFLALLFTSNTFAGEYDAGKYEKCGNGAPLGKLDSALDWKPLQLKELSLKSLTSNYQASPSECSDINPLIKSIFCNEKPKSLFMQFVMSQKQ